MIVTAILDNRSISFALFLPDESTEKTTPVASFRISAFPARTSDEYEALLSAMPLWQLTKTHDVEAVILASVVPSLTDELHAALGRLLPQAACLTVGAGLRTGFTIRTDSPAELGADLVANISGALTALPPPFLVLHCGAVTTLCAVEGSEETPAFSGCCILPGLSLNAAALRDGAALLSAVSLSAPRHAIGTNSADSMRSGLVFGHVAALKGLIDRFEDELGKGKMPVIITGEEADILLPILEIEALCDGYLAHKGLYRIAVLNAAKIEKARKRYQ